jgi:hypothetical protein
MLPVAIPNIEPVVALERDAMRRNPTSGNSNDQHSSRSTHRKPANSGVREPRLNPVTKETLQPQLFLVGVGEIKSRHIIGDAGALSDAIDDVAARRISKRRRISKKLAAVLTGVPYTGRFEVEEVTFSDTVVL